MTKKLNSELRKSLESALELFDFKKGLTEKELDLHSSMVSLLLDDNSILLSEVEDLLTM